MHVFEPRPSAIRERRGPIRGQYFLYAAHVASGEIHLAFRVRSGETSEVSVVGRGSQALVGYSSSCGRVDVRLRGQVVARGRQGGRQVGTVNRNRSGYRIYLAYDVVPCGARYLASRGSRRKGSPCGSCEYGADCEYGGAGRESESFLKSLGKHVREL